MAIKQHTNGQWFHVDDTTGEVLGPAMNPNIQAPEVGAGEAALIGFGKGVHDIGVNLGLLDRPENSDQIMSGLRDQHPWATRIGEAVPAVFSPTTKGRMLGYPIDFATGVFTGEPDTPWLARGIEGVAGREAGEMATRILTKAGQAIKAYRTPIDVATKNQRRLADQAERVGLKLTPAATGSTNAKNLESYFDAGPFTGAFRDEIAEQNTVAFNRALGDMAGLPERYIASMDRFTYDDLLAARKINGEQFQEVAYYLGDINFSKSFNEEVVQNGLMNDDLFEVLKKRGVTIPKTGPFTLNGHQAMLLRQQVNELYGAAVDSKPVRATRYHDIMDELDDYIMGSAGEHVANLYSDARQQWQVLNLVMNSPTLYDSGGGIKAKSLWNNISKSEIERADVQKVKEMAEVLSAKDLAIPYNTSGTARAGQGIKQRVGNYAIRPIARQWYENEGGGLMNLAETLAAPGPGERVLRAGGNLGRGVSIESQWLNEWMGTTNE